MAKFCAECGAPLEEGARFCGSCGTPVERTGVCSACGAPLEAGAAFCGSCGAPVQGGGVAPQQPAADEAAAPAPQAAFQDPAMPGQDGPAASVAVTPRVKKPLPKWVLPAGIAVAAVAVLLVATSLILGHLASPERTIDKFLDAMEAGNLTALSKVAETAADRISLTAESTAPMFALYDQSVEFRKNLENLLEADEEKIDDGQDPYEGRLVDLKPEKKFLHTAYKVVIETCDMVTLESNMACEVALTPEQTVYLTAVDDSNDGWDVTGPDYGMAAWSSGVAYDVLPGLYNVEASVETSYGETFEAQTTITVSDTYSVYGELHFDYTTLEVYNDSDMEVELYIGDQLYGTVPSYSSYLIAPIRPETQLEARADVGADEPMTEVFDASDGYRELRFVLCEVTIYSDYAVPIRVYRDDAVIAEMGPYEEFIFQDLPIGTVLTLELVDVDAVDLLEYTCSEEFDYLYPDFALTDEAELALRDSLSSFIVDTLGMFNGGDLAGLEALSEIAFAEELYVSLEWNQGITAEEDGYTTKMQMTYQDDLEITDIYLGGDSGSDAYKELALTASVYCDFPLQLDVSYTYADGETETDSYEEEINYSFTLKYLDGAWTVIG